MFHAGDKNSFDIGLGGPEDYVVSFFFNSDDFFSKLHHLSEIATVPAPLKGAPTIQNLFSENLVRLLIKSGYNSRNIFWTYSYRGYQIIN